MPSAMVDATVAAAPPLDLNARRRAAALSNANANATIAASPKPKGAAKTVASRYLTAFSKPTSAAERAQPDAADATTTTRTLAVAFQSPTYSLDTTIRARSASPVAVPAATPEMKKKKKHSGTTATAAARAKVFDASQNAYRWPAAASCGGQDLHGPPRRASVDGGNEYLLALSSSSDETDTSSSSGDGILAPPRRSVGSGPPRPSPRSAITSSSARFTMGTRADRFVYPATPSPAPVKNKSLFNGLLSSPFGRSSLNKHPAASKPEASAFRRTARRSTEAGKASSSTGCGLDGDTKLKPAAAIKAEEEHGLRLLYTQHLQWRLVNAHAGAALSSHTTAAGRTLSGAWISILRMRKSVAVRKMQLQLLRNNCKLMAVLRGQMKYLEEWSFLERDYAHSLSGTTQALNATILRLPVSNGAMGDTQGIKNALSSAVDVMHTLGNSCTTQLPKLTRANVLVSQLSRVFIQEHILIEQCRDLLSILASMHVKYSSLQGQRIQLNQRRLQHFQ